MLITIAATVFVFSLIVFVHELGHFATAKWTGMQVDEFAIGFGPKIYSCRYGPTEYSLRAIPLGGFNKIAGMSEEETLDEHSFLSKSVPVRLLVIAAGAAMNFVLAILIMWGLLFVSGTQTIDTEPVIGSVMEHSAAAGANLQQGDRIIRIGDTAVAQWTDIPKVVSQYGQQVVDVTVQRDGQEMHVSLIPQMDSASSRAVIGVMPVIHTQRHGFGESAVLAVQGTGNVCYRMIVGLYDMVRGTEKADLAGPIGVAQLAGQVASIGFTNLLMFTAFLSINLGILNLLPIPILDGGHIVFCLWEMVSGRPVGLKTREIAQQVGLVMLLGLMALAFYNDIIRYVVKQG